jgi:hypothetical protein
MSIVRNIPASDVKEDQVVGDYARDVVVAVEVHEHGTDLTFRGPDGHVTGPILHAHDCPIEVVDFGPYGGERLYVLATDKRDDGGYVGVLRENCRPVFNCSHIHTYRTARDRGDRTDLIWCGLHLGSAEECVEMLLRAARHTDLRDSHLQTMLNTDSETLTARIRVSCAYENQVSHIRRVVDGRAVHRHGTRIQ